jgi:hypothetical protein
MRRTPRRRDVRELLDDVTESRAWGDRGVLQLFEQMPDLPMKAAS